jgi:hypothetical protein
MTRYVVVSVGLGQKLLELASYSRLHLRRNQTCTLVEQPVPSRGHSKSLYSEIHYALVQRR